MSAHTCCGTQYRTSYLASVVIIVSIALLWFIKEDDCLGGALTWFGLMSAQVPASFPFSRHNRALL